MPLPKPQESESRDEFLERCMSSEVMQNEFPDLDQRLAVCQQQYQGSEKMADKFVEIKKTEPEKQIVWGVAYGPPNVLDSDGEAMTKETIENMAYNFMREARMDKIDIGHSFKESGCLVVESFIARKGDPDFPEGSWVIAVECPDEVWKLVKEGRLNGFSIGVFANPKRARALIEIDKEIISISQKNTDGVIPEHEHQYVVYFSNDGRVVKGKTDVVFDHYHEITGGTRTDMALGHSHRITLDG
jgi:hypothetical protein